MPKYKLRLLAALACIVLIQPAIGSQEVNQADLEACLELPGDDVKLACYRALTLRGRTELRVSEETVSPPVVQDQPVIHAPAVASAPVPKFESTQTAPPRLDDDFGKEHLSDDADSAEPERFNRSATIVKVEKRSHGTLYFYVDNGQVWRQIEPRSFPYPKNRAFQVELDQGMMGDYRLQVEGKGQKTRIRRVK
jgi:hypothetical protein